jgi:CubicO group peptidase (beta-lactamase class C family)
MFSMKRSYLMLACLAAACSSRAVDRTDGSDTEPDLAPGLPDGGAPGGAAMDGASEAIALDAVTTLDSAPAGYDGAGTLDLGAVDAQARDFGQVQSVLVQRAAAAGVTSMGLAIWDAQDRKVYEHMLGDFTGDTRVAVASASKLVAGLVLFDVMGRGLLGLDSTTGDILDWTGPNAALTVRQLLSFTSGLPKEAACTLNPLTTLANCADTLADATVVAPPGTEFDYGSTHLLVAGAMAEAVTGQRWNDLFAETLQTPLGLPSDVTYFTAPRQSLGKINPLIAGGLRASMNEYRHFLALAFHKGRYGGLAIGTEALFDAQAKTPYPDAAIGNSPMPSARYGLACWLECATPTAGCQRLSSPGAFGFTPWLDREAGYYAILGMELASTGNDEGVVAFAVTLEQEIAPLIATVMQP